MSAESAIREVLTRIDAAWRNKAFDGLERCFHEHAVIVGPGYVEYAKGRDKCAGSLGRGRSRARISLCCS